MKEDEDGAERLWGKCAAVEGLFAEPAPLPREVLTLRGCRPAGVLSEALTHPGGSPLSLGDLCVEVQDGAVPEQWWTLVDVAVLAQRPHPDDPERYDIVLGAGVTTDDGSACSPPAAPRFELFAGPTVTAAGSCAAVDGLYRTRKEPTPVPLRLIGCEPAEPLLRALRRPQRVNGDWARLLVLDRDGAAMASLVVGLSLGETRPSVIGGALVDVTLTDGGDERPVPADRAVWAQWFHGPPETPNQWAVYDARGRAAWLDLTTRAWRTPAPRSDRSGGVHRLDGRFVTDVPGLHCALSEALLGPGGYFGRGWNAFRDCLCGGFGVVPPFTLIWHDSEVARRSLVDVVHDAEGGLSYFQEVVALLERCGVSVVLE
ncbi:barstar family protein [Streptomyces pseudogriseolus]|uniref:barstar family protein n=1 Tax=Streptomyces pseudogriseolus TaxID=36817 RepID=UPI003FA1CA16